MKAKIGIFSGSFDPIHLGHITFALQAIDDAKLDKVYFLPERTPRGKESHEHFGHRVAMIKRAIKPHPKLDILDLNDRTFSINKTLPTLESIFKKERLVFLFGSDKIDDLINWPNADRLLTSSEIIIGLRNGSSIDQLTTQTLRWPQPPLKIIFSYWPAVLSTEIRRSIRKGEAANGLVKSVDTYIKQNWLYVSLEQ